MPQVATVTGLIVDARSGAPVADASITVTRTSWDVPSSSTSMPRARSNSATLPLGTARPHRRRAAGYLATVTELPRVSSAAVTSAVNLVMNKLPAKPGVTMSKSESRFHPAHHLHRRDVRGGWSNRWTSSKSLAGYVLDKHERSPWSRCRCTPMIQGRQRTKGACLQDRAANKIAACSRDVGVAATRITAKGYGPDQPLAPNVSEANRAKNRRVQVLIGGTATAPAADQLGI